MAKFTTSDALAQGRPGNIQGIPTPWEYVSKKGGGTNNILLGLAHYWIGGSTVDSIASANFVTSPAVPTNDIVFGAAGGPITTCVTDLGDNTNICPQANLSNYAAPQTNFSDMTGGPGVSFSMQIWIKPLLGSSGFGGCQTVTEIFTKWNPNGSPGPSNEWRLIRPSSGQGINFEVFDLTNQAVVTAPICNFDFTNWTHIVCVYDDTKTNLTVYSNAVPIRSVGVAGVTNNGVTAVEIYNATQRNFDQYVGNTAEEAWWTNTALSSNDVARLYDFGAGWPFSQFGPGWPAPVALNNGGLVQLAATFPGNIYCTFDGSIPMYSTFTVSNALLTTGLTPPSGSFVYDAPFAMPWDCTLMARGTNRGVPIRILSTNLVSIGKTWSNNVVSNGGASPSVNSVTNLNLFAAGLNSNSLVPFTFIYNPVATDSLVAATTPLIYVKGNQPWVNHAFVAGDLTVNGLTGNGSTKYLDTGFIGNGQTQLGSIWYTYQTNGVGSDFSCNDAANLFQFVTRFNDGKTYVGDGAAAAEIIITTSPGYGCYFSERTGSTTHKAYMQNSGFPFAQVGATDSTAFTAYPTVSLLAFANNPNGGAVNEFCGNTDSFFGVTLGLTTAQAQNLFTGVQALRTAFGGGFR